MSHLTEEQFEDILHGKAQVPAHVGQCPECQGRLAEKRALSGRLRSAFSSVAAGTDLADRIAASIGAAPAAKAPSRILSVNVRRRLWSALAAAAAILILAVPAGLYISTTSQAKAAQTELVQIHQDNLNSLDGLFVHDDPKEITRYFQDEVGYRPATVCTGSGLSMCGCCVRKFRGRPAGCYVVKAQSEPVSIVVAPNAPKSLGLTRQAGRQDAERPVWRATCKGCNIASVRIGDRSYYAVGNVPQKDLDGVLGRLLD